MYIHEEIVISNCLQLVVTGVCVVFCMFIHDEIVIYHFLQLVVTGVCVVFQLSYITDDGYFHHGSQCLVTAPNKGLTLGSCGHHRWLLLVGTTPESNQCYDFYYNPNKLIWILVFT